MTRSRIPNAAHSGAKGLRAIVFAALGLLVGAPVQAAITFQLRTGNSATNTQSMIVDSNQCPAKGPTSMYVGGIITNTGPGTVTGISANLANLNANVFLTGGQAGTQSIGSLAVGESIGVYWFTGYGCTENATATPTVQIASSAGTASTALTLTIRKAISANAGGRVNSATLGPGAVVGQTVHFDASYDFGGSSTGDEYFLQPAGGQNFAAGCFRLVGTEVLTSNINGVPVGTKDKLYFTQPNPQSGNGYFASMRYSFQYLCAGTNTIARPYAVQTSGSTNIKYTGNFDGTGSISVSYPGATNPFTITKSVSPTSGVAVGSGVLAYTVTVSNPSIHASVIDKIVDVLPSGISFAALSAGGTVTAANSSSLPVAGATGTLTFLGKLGQSYAIPAGGSVTLTYTANRPSTAGTYTNSAQGHMGQATTLVANATYNLVALQPLTATKVSVVYSDPVRGTTNPLALPGAIIEYHIEVSNPNAIPMDTDSVIVSDQTPANIKLCLSDLASPGAGPVRFAEGSPASSLVYAFTSLGNAGDSLDFSSDGGASWTYAPSLDPENCDAAITHFRVRPTGSLAASGAFSLDVRYRVN